MKLYTIVVIIISLFILLPDIFFFLKLKKHHAKVFLQVINFLPTVFFITAFMVMKFKGRSLHDPDQLNTFMWILFSFILIYIPKFVYLVFHFLNYIVNLFLKDKIYLIRYAGVLVAMFLIIVIAHGAFVNAKNVETKNVEIKVKDLPAAFNGYKIVQISDIHLGSWGRNHSYLTPAIKAINDQDADLLIFSGDMVNNLSAEMDGWKEDFLQMKVKDGKYAVLGNHDYGDYTDWKTDEKKQENLNQIEQNIRSFGFRLLQNETIELRRDSSRIELSGVENWGKDPFPKYGDLDKALAQSNDSLLKILISHDPSHWRAEVLGKHRIFLTLSGHTHAAQMAFNMYGKLVSPSSLIYKEWNGLYQEGDQYLYINKGLGFIGLPVRLGVARPEVTVITLKTEN